ASPWSPIRALATPRTCSRSTPTPTGCRPDGAAGSTGRPTGAAAGSRWPRDCPRATTTARCCGTRCATTAPTRPACTSATATARCTRPPTTATAGADWPSTCRTCCACEPRSSDEPPGRVRRLWPSVDHRRRYGSRVTPVAPRPLHEIVEAGWAKALEPVAGRIAEMGDFLRAEIAAGRTYLPSGANVLRAFQQPFDEVRVLIVGQDPYPTPGHAVGLSFSVAPDVRPLPGSLINIFRELHQDLGLPQPSTGDLTPWTEQGVLLLNRALTTAPRRPAAHRGKGWEEVTEQAIRALAARGKPLVSILWGRDARNCRPLLGDLPSVESAHPSPMSADRGFFGSRPFSRANDLLIRQGGQPVDWRLP